MGNYLPSQFSRHQPTPPVHQPTTSRNMWRGRRPGHSTCPGGLCIPAANNKPVPLKDIKIEAAIQGFVCKVTSTLQYENVEDEAIEAKFVFPMDEDSAVYEFEAEIDDRKIVAECQDSEQAQQTYEDAMSQGHTSVLLSQDMNSADVFECSVGNLPPHKSAVIRFSYVKELPLSVEGGVQFVLPTILNPRYNPKPADGGVTDSKLDNASFAPNKIPYSFHFQATVQNDKEILNVKSNHEDVTSEIGEDKTSAVLTLKKNFVPDHDLSFEVFFARIYEPGAIFAQGDGNSSGILKSNVLALNFFPELDETVMRGEKEFIFVMDRSGSMGGSNRMGSAKETLLLFLKSLPADCYFNIVSFGSRHEFLFPGGSSKYSEESLQQACALQENMEANFGGTEILRPLEDIYRRPLIDGYPRQVFVLTDGEVYNVSTVVALVKKNAGQARVFSFGIGEGASTALVKGIARAGQGRAVFVKDGERLQPKVMRILKCAMQEGVQDVKLTIEGSDGATVVPQPAPPLYSGDRLVLYALIPGESLMLSGQAVLRAQLTGKPLEFSIPLSAAKPTRDLAIHRLAAKAQIAQLEAMEGETKEDESKETETKTKEMKQKIILLSTSANIVSTYTSMVGVDSEKSGAEGKVLEKRRVPVPGGRGMRGGGPGGFGGFGGAPMARNMAMAPMAMACSAPMSDFLSFGSAPPPPPPASGGRLPRCAPSPTACPPPEMADRSMKMMSKTSAPPRAKRSSESRSALAMDAAMAAPMDDAMDEPSPSPSPPQGYMALVSLQGFSGAWALTEALATALGQPLEAITAGQPAGLPQDVWATALALAALGIKYAGERDEWEMVEMKAMQWLAKQACDNTQALADGKKFLQQ